MSGRTHPAPEADDLAIDWVVEQLCVLTGIARESMRLHRLASACRKMLSSGVPLPRILRDIGAEQPEVIAPLLDAACVSETYFFRQPAHFDWLISDFVPRWLRSEDPVLRVWSAGCATGEEAWSLAGALHSALRTSGRRVEILATDLVDGNLGFAINGRYALRALREEPSGRCVEVGAIRQGRFEIHRPLRTLVHFQHHNLLCAAPRRGFHLIFCRNVLVYFTQRAVLRAMGNLTSALLAGNGVLVLGPTDVPATPGDMQCIGSPGLCAFVRSAGPAAERLPSEDDLCPPMSAR